MMPYQHELLAMMAIMATERDALRAENVALKERLAKADQPLERALFTLGRLLDDLSLSVIDRPRVESVRREVQEARAALVAFDKMQEV